MSIASTLPSHEASICFFDADHELYKKEKPYVCLVPLTHAPPDFSQTNIQMARHNVQVKNIRGVEGNFELDVHGFQLVRHSPKFNNWYDGPKVVTEYYPYVADFLKRQLGADKVYIYDHSASTCLFFGHLILEFSDFNQPQLRLGDHVDGGERSKDVQGRPAVLAHVDNSMTSTILQIREDFKEDAESLLSKRFQIINFWHPIMEPVMQQPIAFCDYRTARDDAYPSDLVYPHLVSENMLIKHSADQQWYFIDAQMMDEAWLIKIADSSNDSEVAKFCPHTSFTVRWRDDKEALLRQSIELRAYVFYA